MERVQALVPVNIMRTQNVCTGVHRGVIISVGTQKDVEQSAPQKTGPPSEMPHQSDLTSHDMIRPYYTRSS